MTEEEKKEAARLKKNARNKIYRDKNKEKIAAYGKVNKEKIAAYQKDYREDNKEEKAAKAKDYRKAKKEEKADYDKDYRKAKKEEIAAYMKIYNEANKESREAKQKAYTRTIKGLISKIHSQQKQHSKQRGHQPPTYSRKELHVWIIAQSNFKELYDNWTASRYKKDLIPSVDRLNNSKGYSFDNIQLMTWRENLLKH